MKNRKETNRLQKFTNQQAFNRLKRIALNDNRASQLIDRIRVQKVERQLFEAWVSAKYSQPPRPNQRKRRKLARQVPHGTR